MVCHSSQLPKILHFGKIVDLGAVEFDDAVGLEDYFHVTSRKSALDRIGALLMPSLFKLDVHASFYRSRSARAATKEWFWC